jgi:hypothetical protein
MNDDDPFIEFYVAADLLAGSVAVQVKTLRELCADGTIRAIRPDGEIIRPSNWRSDEVDLMGPVGVSENDLQAWLAKSRPDAVGKRPRIVKHLATLYPDGVPHAGLAPRKALKADLLRRDSGLAPLDEATLKVAIEAYNKDR